MRCVAITTFSIRDQQKKLTTRAIGSHLHNTVLNFHTEDRMPVSQLFKPSNPYARISNHYYMSQSEEEVFTEQVSE